MADEPVIVPAAPSHEPIGWRALLKPSLMITAAVIVLLDVVTKAMIGSSIHLYESVTIVPGFLDFTHVRNTGAAFGLLNTSDLPMKGPIMIGLALVAIIAIGAYGATLRPHEKAARAGLALVLGGAVGNLIGRAQLGYVLDFVDVYFGHWHFWAFNVADAAITVGAIFVIFDLLRDLLGLRRHASHTV